MNNELNKSKDKAQNLLITFDKYLTCYYQGKYLSGIPDYFPDGHSSGTLNYRSSGNSRSYKTSLKVPISPILSFS